MRKVLNRTGSRTRREIGYRIGPGIASVLLSLSDFWIILFAGIFLAATVLAINLVGDGLRDALDVR